MRTSLGAVALLTILAAVPAAAADAAEIAVPEGYVRQELMPTYGAIARPKDWFACSAGTASGWLWTFSREDCKGEYDTGMRIQMFIGFKKAGFAPEAFIAHFIAEQRAANKVLSECAPQPFGTFTKKCLEVLQTASRGGLAKTYRIQYSAFWDGDDMAVITTFGTPADQWDAMRETGNVMSKFVLIGDKFWQNQPAPGGAAQ